MDRADKAKQYRKIMNRRQDSLLQPSKRYPKASITAGGGRVYGILWLGLLVASVLVLVFLIIQTKRMDTALSYMTKEEFASLMSFLDADALPLEWQNDGDERLTKGEIRNFIQSIGLSAMITVAGGNDKIKREEAIGYYEQIRDYLDLEESVAKQTILCLQKSKDSCTTAQGKLRLNVEAMELEPFHTYEVYTRKKKILGVCAELDKEIALKNVTVKEVKNRKAIVDYQDQEYQIPCKKAGQLQANSRCTLYISGGQVTKAANIEKLKNSEFQARAGQDAVGAAKKVKVLLLDGGAIYRKQAYVTCEGDCTVIKGKSGKKYAAQDLIHTKALKLKNGSYAKVTPQKEADKIYLADGNGSNISKGYYGSVYIYKDTQGYYIVNEVNIEKYLYSVVASEMPSYFAGEALKAQAVCARSYVYRQMEAEDYHDYHAHIDDSTNYQVYNKSDVQQADIEAVEDTAGLVMYAGDEIVDAYYYSTSCGYGAGMEIWNQDNARSYLKAKAIAPASAVKQKFDLSKETDFKAYLAKQSQEYYDSTSPYFRWKATIELSAAIQEIKDRMTQRHALNPQNILFYSTVHAKEKKVSSLKGFGGIQKMYCSKRSKSGAVLELTIEFEFGKAKIKSEYNIRSIIGCAMEKITYADGKTNTESRFLPSAYFISSFQKKTGRYLLTGGGNGHGMGMSQYAADNMAKDGWNYEKILKFFYNGITIKKIS